MVRHNRSWLYLFLVVVLIGSLGLLAGCAGDDEPAEDTGTTGAPGDTTTTGEAADREGQPGGTAVHFISEPAFIDPVNAQESEGIEVVHNIFDGLVTFDPIDSEILPAVAESWEANEDGTVWTFNLRQGVMFHNGREVTAQDFKYAWERIVNPENESEIAYHLSAIQGFDEMQDGSGTELTGVRAVDDYTLEVTLSYAFGDFPYVTGHPSLGPVPQEAVEEGGWADMPIGNGPFMMAEPWAHDQYIRVVRFDDYYGETALLDGVEFRIMQDEETAFLEFRAGNIDFTRVPSGQLEATIAQYGESEDGLEPSPGAQVLVGPETAIYYIGLQTDMPPMDNVDLRRAVSLAINRQAIADTVYEGSRTPAAGIVPEGVAGFQEDAWEYARYDQEEARQFLEQAGYPNGEGLDELVLGFNSGAGHEDVMQLVQADLAAIGIRTRFDSLEFAQYLDKLDEGNEYHLWRLGWLADYPIMDNFLYPLLTSDSADNHARYSNPEFDNLVREARSITDEDERFAAYQEAEQLAGQDAPLVPIVNYRHRDIASERIRGLIFDPMGLTHWDLAWIEE
jgi:oligopeptide transport system substrate-binding protein